MSLVEIRVSVRANRFSIYSHFYGDRNRAGIAVLQGSQARLRQHGLSRKASQNVKDAIDTLLCFASYKTVFVKNTKSYFRYKVNFITLTLPSKQIHSDKEVLSKCFIPFLKAWRRRRPKLLYIWKAEIQDNGNIHFHITSNAFYHYRNLRRDWNKFINKLGYVDRSSSINPNSTDVHSVRNVKNLGAYLSSYYTKKDNYTRVLKRYFKRYYKSHRYSNSDKCIIPKNYFKFIKRYPECQLWNCSLILKKCKLNVDYYDKKYHQEFEQLFDQSTAWDLRYSEHATTLYNWLNYFDKFKSLSDGYFDAFNELLMQEIELSKEVETVESVA